MARLSRLFIGLCALSSGCAPQIHVVQDYRATFLCDDGRSVQADFSAGKAVLQFPGGSATLIQEAGETDKFLYRGEGQIVRQNGDGMNWTDDKGSVHGCRRTLVGRAMPGAANP